VSWWQWLSSFWTAPAVRLKAARVTTDHIAVRARVDAGELDAYLKAVEDAVRELFTPLPARAGEDLLLRCSLSPGERAAYNTIVPLAGELLDAELLTRLFSRLAELPIPQVRSGPVEFYLVLELWGGSRARPINL
jgi:hypothetical protein